MALIVAFGNPVYDEIITPSVATAGRVLSGCSTNGCLALTRLGHRAALVGNIGPDYHQRFLADMRRYGVTPYAEMSAQTGGFRLIYDAAGSGNRTLDVLGCAGPVAHVPDLCAVADAMIIGPILQETPLALIERIMAVSTAPLLLDPQGLLRELDPGERIAHTLHPDIRRIAPLCQVIKANEVEAHVLTGVPPRGAPGEAARRLRELGCRIAIVTLAELGSVIDDGVRQYRIPAYATAARDPTGAGDTYMAGFLHAYLANPDDLYAAGCTGAATASIWIEHTGPDAPICPHEVDRRTATLLCKRPGVV